MERLRRLSDRLDMIETALSVALQEPEPEHRGRMLSALDSATAAVRAEQREAEEGAQQERSSFRVIQGDASRPDLRPRQQPPAGAVSAEHWMGRIPDRAARSAG